MNVHSQNEKRIFYAASEVSDPAERTSLLDLLCDGDANLRARVDALFLADESRMLDRSAPDDDLSESGFSSDIASTVVGPFKLLQKIGEGGFGVVYMAEQQEPVVRRVALKIVKPGMDSKQVIARFEAERQALAMMKHPNIAKVLEAGQTGDGRPYFVMELVRGVSIVDYCDQKKLTNQGRLHLFRDVCGAVQHAHQKGIIHRDLKPSNILVTLHDGHPVPKVIDFGIAKATQQRLTDKTLFTRFEQFIGTPVYMSPEQAEMSDLDVDTRSDIYSLGVLLYELLTGQTPFDRKEFAEAGFDEMRRRIREVDPPTPSTRVIRMERDAMTIVATNRQSDPAKMAYVLQGDLDWIVMKAMEKDRNRRYATANALADDVSRYLRQEAVLAVPPSFVYRLRKFVGRNRAALVTATVIAMILVASAVVSTWQAIRASHQVRLTAESERKARLSLYVSEMNVAQDAVETGNIERAVQLLNNHIPKPGDRDLRGFEWRYLWDQSHRELFSITTDDPIFDVDLSVDGKMLATAARGGQIRIWDLESRQLRGQFKLDTGRYVFVAFSPDGEQIAVCSSNLGQVTLWDIERQREIKQFPAKEVSGLRDVGFTPNGKKLFAGEGGSNDRLTKDSSSKEGSLWIWDIESGEADSFKQHHDSIWAVSCSPDGNRFATTSVDGAVKILNFTTRETLVLQPEIAEAMRSVRFSPNGDLVVTVPRLRAMATVWNAKTGGKSKLLNFPFETNEALFSPDGNILFVAEMTGALSSFDAHTWTKIATYYHHGHQLNTVAISPTNDRIVSVGDNGKILVWPIQPEAKRNLLSLPWAATTAMYSADGTMLGIGDMEGGVHIWDTVADRKRFVVPPTVTNRGLPAARLDDDFFTFHPDGRRLARLSDKEKTIVEVWDLISQKRVQTLTHGYETVNCVVYSPDGTLLATGTNNEGRIRFWDAETCERVGPCVNENRSVVCMAFSPDSRLLASEGMGDVGAHVWDVSTRRLVSTLKAHVQPVGDIGSLEFSPDGSILATAGYDRQVILWNTKTWKETKRLLGHMFRVHDLSFSPDGKRLASGAWDGWTKVWHIETGQEVARFVGNALDFSPDGRTLAITGAGGEAMQTDLLFDDDGLITAIKPGSTFLSVRLHRAPSVAAIYEK